MKAETLEQALNLFDPERPLRTEQELQDFFIEREQSPLQELALFLRITQTAPKILFTGHRGSGKSTELAKLTLMLKDEFFIVNYSVKNVINLFDIRYVDVLLSLAAELLRTALDSEVKLKKDLLSDIHEWFSQEVIKEVTIDTKGEASIGAALNLYVAKLESKLGTESSTRTIVREKVEPRLSELLERVDIIVAEVERLTKKRVLVIVEDLDKADLNSAKDLFCGHGMSLTHPRCRIIYTFPIALRHDNDFIQICQGYDEVHALPNFKVSQRDGRPDTDGRTQLSQIVLRRAETELFTKEALERLAELSGGLPRELVTLSRRSCLIALTKDAEKIDKVIVDEAGNRLRNEYRVLLTTPQIETLKVVSQKKRVENDEAHRALLHNLSVLEYRNQSVWYDVHPVVRPLLEEGA